MCLVKRFSHFISATSLDVRLIRKTAVLYIHKRRQGLTSVCVIKANDCAPHVLFSACELVATYTLLHILNSVERSEYSHG